MGLCGNCRTRQRSATPSRRSWNHAGTRNCSTMSAASSRPRYCSALACPGMTSVHLYRRLSGSPWRSSLSSMTWYSLRCMAARERTARCRKCLTPTASVTTGQTWPRHACAWTSTRPARSSRNWPRRVSTRRGGSVCRCLMPSRGTRPSCGKRSRPPAGLPVWW